MDCRYSSLGFPGQNISEQWTVNTDSGWITCETISIVINSRSDGIRCQCFQSSANTAQIACCCSSILAIMLYVEPHLVVTSEINLCSGSHSSSCFWRRSQLFFQLQLKSPTRVSHLLMACCTLLICRALLIARSRLCPKQLSLSNSRRSNAEMKLDPLSVVVKTSLSWLRLQLASMSWNAARFSPVQ